MENGTEENNAGSEDQNKQEEFNLEAFTEEAPVQKAPELKSEENNAGAGTEENQGSDGNDKSDDDSASFDWNSYDDKPDDGKGDDGGEPDDDEVKRLESEKTAADALKDKGEGLSDAEKDKAERLEKEKLEKEDGESSFNDENFSTFAEELGLSATNKEEFVSQIQELEAENQRLRESQGSNIQNERIGRLNELKKNTDEDLVRLDLKKQGLNEAEVEEAMDIYTDNNTVKIEALKIKKQIDRAIKNEQNNVTESSKLEEAKFQKEQEESVAALTEHISGEKTKFGFQMAKDEESLKKVHKEHTEYITSGTFYNEITSDSKNLSDVAWLWKHRETITKALGNQGIQKGRKEILDNIGSPEVSDSKRFSAPEGSGEFDAGAFLSGN
jgi:hypothetical protein